MKREKELAERRKNEPKLDQNQDHLVRKMFSRFRKGGSASSNNLLAGSTSVASCSSNPGGPGSGTLPNGPSRSTTPTNSNRDIEKGEGGVEETSLSPRKDPPVLVKSAKEEETVRPTSTSAAKSKWGRFMRNSAGSSAETVESCDPQTQTQTQQALLPKAADAATKVTGTGNKVYPKLSRVPERQESIDDPPTNRITVRSVIESAPDSGPIPHKVAGGGETETAAGDPAPSIIDSFTELKHQVHDEVKRINHKMTRLEDILGEILTRLTPTAAPSSAPATTRPGRPGKSQPSSSSLAAVDAVSRPFLSVPGTSESAAADESAAGRHETTRSRTGRRNQATRHRPRSAGSSSAEKDKISTQFQEYF